MPTATIIGSGPNGLSAAIVLAGVGVSTTIFERNVRIGGACSTAETTPPNFRQDLGFSVYALGVAKPLLSLASHKNSLDRTNRSMRSPARRRNGSYARTFHRRDGRHSRWMRPA